MRILANLACRYPSFLILNFVLAILSSAFMAPVPYLAKIILDDILPKGIASGGAATHFGIPDAAWAIAGLVALGIFLKLVSSLLAGWQSHYILRITRNTLYEVRMETLSRLMGAKQKLFESMEPGRIAARISNDVNQMDASIFTLLRGFVSSFFLIIMVLGLMFMMNPWLTVIVLVTLPLTALGAVLAFRKMKAYNLMESDRTAALSGLVAETFGGIKILRTFNAEPYFLKRIQDQCEVLRKEGISHWTLFHTINALIAMVSTLGGDIFLFVGGILAIQKKISFGEFFAFYSYQAMLWSPINTLLNAGQVLQSGIASAEKVKELGSAQQEPFMEPSHPALSPQKPFVGEIRCSQLSFGYYDDEMLIRDLEIHVKPGTMTALVGQSGSGKSTFIHLLMGFYLPSSGRLEIDGLDIREWDLRKLRAQIGMVLQDTTLFNETLRSNLLLGMDGITDKQIWTALHLAHLADFVKSLPEGLDTVIGMGGCRLSGGQKQRVAIARVFLRNPALLILDEATSALDTETEQAIQRSFDALMQGRTSIVIAHRLSTIYKADQILVMHQGRLVESGTHRDLVKKPMGHYRQLYEAQIDGLIPMSGPTRNPLGSA